MDPKRAFPSARRKRVGNGGEPVKDFLLQLRLFRSLAGADRAARLSFKTATFSKKQILFREGEKAAHLWVLKEGLVKLVKGSAAADSLTLEMIFPGEVFGRSVLGRKKTYSAAAVALSDGSAVRIPSAAVLKMLRESPAMASEAAAILEERSEHSDRMRLLARKPVRERLIAILKELSRRFKGDVPLSHREVAHLAGTRMETVIRVLSALQREGRLEKEYGFIRMKKAPFSESVGAGRDGL